MTLNLLELNHLDYPNTSEKYHFIDFAQKPIEIYVFTDPLCPDCWSLEPYIRKLSLEYGYFFTIRPIISSHTKSIHTTNLKHSSYRRLKQVPHHVSDNTLLFPSLALAIKAAELQGKSAGRSFLRKVQENFFLKEENITDLKVLIECAESANIDIDEFKKDLHSAPARKAFQADQKITKEMDIEDTPSIVIFSQYVEDQCVKVSGMNSYDIYVLLLKKMLQSNPYPNKKPPIEQFLAYYDVIHIKELAIIYDLTLNETEQVLKKLQLKQTVKKILKDNDIFWKYNKNSKPLS